MNNLNPVATYALRLGDNGLVLAQRLVAWWSCAGAEDDLALANIGLDLLGQARNFLSYAANWRVTATKTRWLLVVTSVSSAICCWWNSLTATCRHDRSPVLYQHLAWALFTRLVNSCDERIAAIAAKGLKEVRYHLRFSRARWSNWGMALTTPRN